MKPIKKKKDQETVKKKQESEANLSDDIKELRDKL